MEKIGKILSVILVFVFCMASLAMANEVYEFTLSVETVMDHPRNQGLLIFIKNLEEKSNGRFKVKFYHSAQLYKGVDILKALSLGTVDMGMPGIWWLGKYDPNADLTALPMFYGQPPQVTQELVDGDWGQLINKSLEKKMNTVIPGLWYELGYQELHTTKKKVTKLEDVKGLRIRYAGGAANGERLRAMGANPVPIPWPDVAMALMRGTCDGLITSLKPLHSAKLVDAGITYSIRDREYLMHYIPMCSKKFWSSIPKDLKELFTEVWNEHIPQQRELARKMQLEGELAVEELEKKKGGGIYRPSNEQLAEFRKQIIKKQEHIVQKMGIDSKLVEVGMQKLGMK